MEQEVTQEKVANIPHEVEPIKKLKDVEKIKQYLRGKKSKRDYCLFVVGINIGLRASDLMQIRIGNVIDDKGVCFDSSSLYEKKTSKFREFDLNQSAKESIKMYLDSLKEYKADDFLFKSNKGENNSLEVHTVHYIIKKTCRELNIKGNYGSHTLRKTFSYHIYINEIGTNPGIVQTLQKMLNHSSQLETLKYIGITKDVIKNVYKGLNL